MTYLYPPTDTPYRVSFLDVARLRLLNRTDSSCGTNVQWPPPH